MPNGTMTGSGTSADPYIVMDGYDFNAIRDLYDYDMYVQIGADISLSMYPAFVPIPYMGLNIDGGNHIISDININYDSQGASLFSELDVRDYIKDLILQGNITTNYNSNNNIIYCGALAASISTYSNTSVSNVQAYFNINCSSTRGICVGGLIGTLTILDGSCNITNCSYKGEIQVSSSSTSSSYKMYIGGIVGNAVSWDSNETLLFEKCYSKIKYKIDNRLDMGAGGIFAFASLDSPFNITFSECVADITTQFIHTSAVTTGSHKINGITFNPGTQSSGVTVLLERCVAFIEILWTHQFPINAFYLTGLLYKGNTSSENFTINQGYAIMRFNNPDDIPWTGIGNDFGSLTYLPSTTPTVTVNNAFFDQDVFEEGYDGTYTTTYGVSTTQLKNQIYLEGQGWVFD